MVTAGGCRCVNRNSVARMIIDLYGREIEVLRGSEGWKVFYRSGDGKKRDAGDIVIPANIAEPELVAYLADIYHEYATERNPQVRIIG